MADLHTLTLVTKATSSDTPNQNQAIKVPYANGYWDALAKKVEA